MDVSPTLAGPRKVISFKVVLYSIPCPSSSEIYLDQRAAIKLAHTIDRLIPRPMAIQVIYLTYQCKVQQQLEFIWTDDVFLDRLTPVIFQPLKARNGRDLYRIQTNTIQQYTERTSLDWEVTYQPGEEFDDILHDIQAYQDECSQSLQALFHPSIFDQPNSFMHFVAPAQPPLSVPPVRLFDPVQSEPVIQSGCTTPEERPALQSALDQLVQDMDQQQNNTFPSLNKQRGLIPISQFALAETQAEEDNKAAEIILSRIKLLAINPRGGSKIRWSLQCEKQAINSMSINSSLNIGRNEWTMSEKLNRLFQKYDQDDEEEKESFHRALLMIVIRLLRQQFVYESGKKTPGNYVGDFDKLYNFPTGYIRRGGILCRIVVACGHPSIVVILVRLAIRNRMTLSALLDELPTEQFCHFIASGKVNNNNNNHPQKSDSTCHTNLLWLHGNVLLPLLHTASRRIPEQLCLVDGTLRCDEISCLRVIVHHTKRVKFAHFLAGNHNDAEWARGKVLIENRSAEKQSPPEYTIERDQRTFHQFKMSTFAHIEHFDSPPRFLQSKTLELSLEA